MSCLVCQQDYELFLTENSYWAKILLAELKTRLPHLGDCVLAAMEDFIQVLLSNTSRLGM